MLIRRRYLMMLSVAVGAALLGSLLYHNTTQAQRLQIYKDSVQIPLLRKTATISSLSSPPQLPIDLVLPFTFSPKEQLSDISDAWITYSIGQFPEAHRWYTFNLTLNDQVVISANFYAMSSRNLFSLHSSSSFSDALTQGINVLELSEPYKEGETEVYLEISYVDLFVEYEYQA